MNKNSFLHFLGRQSSTSKLNSAIDGISRRDDNVHQDRTNQSRSSIYDNCNGHCNGEDPNEILVVEELKDS